MATPREALLKRVREYERAAAEQVARLRIQPARAEEFAQTLRARLDGNGLPDQ